MALDPKRWTHKTTEAVQAAMSLATERSNPEVTPVHGVLARGALAVLWPVPPADAFDGGGDLAEGVALSPRRVGRAAGAAAPAFVLLLLAGSFLVRGRELVPRS